MLPNDKELFLKLMKAPIGEFSRTPACVMDAVAQLHTLSDAHLPRPEAPTLCARIHSSVYRLLSLVNPFDPGTHKHIGSISAKTLGTSIHRGRPSPMLLVLGESGLGKTTLIRGVLRLFPTVIEHSEFHGRPFSHLQVPYLTVDAPQGGAISGLCLALAEQLDGALGRSRENGYTKSLYRLSIESQKVVLARALAAHSISVIHVDDIQRISERAPKAEIEAAATIIGLANSVGALLALSGTMDARKIFERSFEAGRRAMSLGAIELNAPRNATDSFYSKLLEMLFRRQLQPNKCYLTQELADMLFSLTGGNTAITVSLYVAVQEYCLLHGREMRLDVFEQVRNEQFGLLVPAIDRSALSRRSMQAGR